MPHCKYTPPAEPFRTDLTLVERERQLSVIFDTIADVTFVLNVDDEGRYRFVFANKAFERTTGVPVAEVVGRYVEEVIPEPSRSLVLAKYHEAVTTSQRVVWQEVSDYPTGRKTGEVSVTPVCDANGCYLVGTVHDLTPEKQVEEALRLSNERFAYALKATTDAIYDWNVADDTLHWGEGFEDLFGYRLTQNPAPFSSWAGYVHPDDGHRAVAGLRRVAFDTTNAFWQEEYRFRRADGSWADVFDRGYILRDAGGRAVRMLGAMQDVTERKKTEAQQRQLTEKLARQNAHLQQCGYMISHNLRAPLANALGFADLVSRVDKDSPVFADSLKNLRTSLHRLDEVLTDVNTILSIREHEEATVPEPVAVAAVCRQALQHAQPELQASGGQAHCHIPEELRIDGNRAFFYSIFDNLIANAIKYRSAARPLQLDIRAAASPAAGTTLVFRDNGSGFDRARAGDDVFKLYRRFHPDKPGRGIGLYLVKTHAEAMNGQVSVESRVNEGTQFTLHFTPPFTPRADENLPD